MDSTVVVTGASRGIGASVARAFGEAGAAVVACARSVEGVEDVVDDVREAGGTGTAVRADVRDEFDVERLLETAVREHGGVDVVVANAGVNHGPPGESPLPGESYSRFDDTLRTNVRGVFTTLKEALPHMPPDGRALVPSGSVAHEVTAGMGAYAVSKAGAEAVARGFAADADQAVGVVDPGYVATDLSGGTGRDPADVAPMFVWAARDADDIDGEILDLRTWKQATR
jgi:3-oxoacyl-[acyl-carrier protein] reductase